MLFINGRTGTTKYYECGRYDRVELGWTRRVPIPDVAIQGGKPTEGSLRKFPGKISIKAGRGGRISAAYIEVPDGSRQTMLLYVQKRVKSNANPKRVPYTLTGNSCMHFSNTVAEEGGATMPRIVDPRPISFIDEIRGSCVHQKKRQIAATTLNAGRVRLRSVPITAGSPGHTIRPLCETGIPHELA